MAEPGEPLSSREHEILCLVATGASNRMIARDLTISPNTVKVHLRNIFTKLEVASRTEATLYAVSQGWVQVADLAGQEGMGEREPAGESLPDPGWPAFPPRPPLPWGQRLYLLGSLVLVAVMSALAWPRAGAAPADLCANEFTAECTEAGAELTIGEPESLWVSAAPLPQAAGRFAMTGLGGQLLVIGGETEDGVVGRVLAYDRLTDSWQLRSDKPTAAANVSAVALDGLVYVPGGSDARGDPLDVLEVYDAAADSWRQAAAMPDRRTAYVAAGYDGRLYLVGGWNGAAYSNEMLIYDPPADRWESGPSMPTARGFAGAVVVGERLIVVGGYDGRREFAVCEQFDLANGRWEKCPPMAAPRGGLGMAVVAGQVYAIGGGWESLITFSERYNPHAARWQNVETPVLLAGGEWRNLGVTALGTQIYAVGGWQNGRYLAVNQAFETLPNRLYLPATAGQ